MDGFKRYGPKPKPITWIVDSRGCHICTSHCRRNGYPLIKHGEKTTQMSRRIFEETYGPIPPNMSVCHTCDNPSCINPEHFFLGTHQENLQDCVRKGRQGNGKLRPEDIPAIRSRLQRGEAGNRIARDYGVVRDTIYAIKDNRQWRCI